MNEPNTPELISLLSQKHRGLRGKEESGFGEGTSMKDSLTEFNRTELPILLHEVGNELEAAKCLAEMLFQ